MGASSTVTLQSVVDYVKTSGSVAPTLPAGGFSTLQAMTHATDVMKDMLAKRFNHKFNSRIAPPFYTNSWQQDYCLVNMTDVAWLENVEGVDINNTALPKPIVYPEAVRDLQRTSWAQTPPESVAWEYNSELTKGVWPGTSQTYTAPLGTPQIPTNPSTVILDANNNILLLTTYGVTAASGTGPVAAAGAYNPNNTTNINDGTCIWTVCNPNGQGWRISPLPPQQGVVFQINVRYQRRPPTFTKMGQLLSPLPDDFAGWFREGFNAYSYKMSDDAKKRMEFEPRRRDWLDALAESVKVDDRERDSAMFVPVSGILDSGGDCDPGPANPFNRPNYYGWRG